MSCTNPNLIKFFLDKATGSVMQSFVGNGSYMEPKDYGTPYVDSQWYVPVPCGKCASCKCDYSRDWANRMILELQDHDDAMFLTLTYNDQHLPISPQGFSTLCKRDIQLFLKRLRKYLGNIKIRYYLAGEYGSRTHRPHYHAIIYGIGVNSFDDIVLRGTNKIGCPFFSSPKLEALWGNGFVLFSSVTWRTCNYVARYVLKKQGDTEDCEGVCLPPFNVSSRKPGIGMLRADYLLSTGHMLFSIDGKDGIHEIPIPRSAIKRLKELDIDKYNDICYNRTMIAMDKLKLEAKLSGLPYHDYLANKNASLLSKLKALPERI